MQTATKTSRSITPAELTLGAVALFFLSFLMSGNANVLPQLFYQRFYPEQKVLLLAVTLFVSTACSIAGVLASRARRLGRNTMFLALALTTAAVVALLSVSSAAAYMPLIAAVQFAANYLLNLTDHTAVARSGSAHRRFNDVAGNVARLLGMLAAPAFFTGFYQLRGVMYAAVIALGAAAVGGAAVLFSGGPGEHRSQTEPSGSAIPDRADRLVFVYAVSVYSSLYLFAANMIYLLRDLLHMPSAETRGGRSIVIVFVAAVVVNAAAGALRRFVSPPEGRRIPVAALTAPALALALSAGLLTAGVRPGFGLFLGFSALVGGGYGAFLIELREYTSHGAREQGKTMLLTWFNNMANVSALIAFGLMVGLALAGRHSPEHLYIWTLLLIGGLPLLGFASLATAVLSLRRTTVNRNFACT